MSDWKRSASARRDTRNTKDGTEVAKNSAKKDTRRWCKGKVGVEHILKCMDKYPRVVGTKNIFEGWKILACTVCGKELDYWWPSKWNKRNKPDWVQ